MSFLRHPVVISTLEEDFRKIGLIKEDAEGSAPASQEEASSDDATVASGGAAASDSSSAEGFKENFQRRWDDLGNAGVETLVLDDDGMDELESCAGLSDEKDSSETKVASEDESSSDDESNDVAEAPESVSMESVIQAMQVISSFIVEDSKEVSSIEEATSAFEEVGKIAVRLREFFESLGKSQDDSEYVEIAAAYDEIAKYSDGVVDVLSNEPDTVDMFKLGGTLKEYLDTVLQGLEAYSVLREASDDEISDDTSVASGDSDDSTDVEEAEGVGSEGGNE